jgi:drug/metabolite transporter (DMT)-like permease
VIRIALAAMAAMVGASALFGAIGAVASQVDLPPGQLLLFLVGTAAVPLAFAGPRLDRPDLPPLELKAVVLLGTINAFQIATYLAGLTLGPVGPVAALHLSVPVVYLVWELARGQRRPGPMSLGVLALSAAGAAIAGLSEGSGSGGSGPIIGLMLAALSAIALAIFLGLVAAWGRERRVRGSAAGIHVTGAALMLPTLALGAPTLSEVGLGVAMGAVLWAPGVLLQWWAVARLPRVVFGTLLLFEAVFTAVIAAIAFGEELSPLVAVAVVLIIGAAGIETQRRARSGPASLEPHHP